MTLELRIRIKRLSNDRGGGEEASPRQSAATAARNRAACSITLSIRDIGRGTRLRGAMHAEVHASRALLHDPGQSHARRPSREREGNDDSRPFEFDSRGIKGIKGVDEEIEGW